MRRDIAVDPAGAYIHDTSSVLNCSHPDPSFDDPFPLWELLMYITHGVGGLARFGKLRIQGEKP